MNDIHNILAETRCFCRPVGTHCQCQNSFWEQVDDSDFVAFFGVVVLGSPGKTLFQN